MISSKDWKRLTANFTAHLEKKIANVEFQVEAKDVVSSRDGVTRNPIYFTDMQFQVGNQLTGWAPHSKEMLRRLSWKHDEHAQIATPNRFVGEKPKAYPNQKRRWFNLVGRGHKVVTVPNYVPEDWDVSVLPTGLDLTLYSKEDFDLLRVSTNVGVLMSEEDCFYIQHGIYPEIKKKYEDVLAMDPTHVGSVERVRREQEIDNFENRIIPLFLKHPLHYRYTREFWIERASSGSEITIHATTRKATVNKRPLSIIGKRHINVHGIPMKIDRMKFLLAPRGTAILRVEFYKEVEQSIDTYDQDKNGAWVKKRKTFKVLKDVGIGYWGTASFDQWTSGGK